MKNLLSAAAVTLVLALAPAVQAQYPDRVIKGVVPFPAGGGTDIFGRFAAEHLGKALGQPVVVENRGGADGNIGMASVAKSAPDGYTLLFNSSAATVNPAMYRTLPFDPGDLVPAAILCEYYNLIFVNPTKVPAKTLGEFVDLMRKNPGKYNIAAGGTRLVVDMFTTMNNLDLAVIPYRGAGDAINALLAGDVDLMIVNAPGLLSHVRSGKIRALAVTAPQRQADLPDVPTTKEAGMPDFTYGSFFGVYVRAGTPPEVVRKLNATLNEITTKPDVVERFRALGAEPVQRTPEEALERYRSDIARLKDVVSRAKIQQLN